MLPLLGLAAAGGALLLFKPKTASASEGSGLGARGSDTGNRTPGTGNRPTSELSEELKKQMAEALGRLGVSPATGKLSGAADADAIRYGSQLTGTLEAMGFRDAAAALRKYVDEASKGVRTPADAAPIAAAAPAGLTQEQRDYIARVMSLEREPNKIALLIDWLKKLSPSRERDDMIQMAQALALQLAAAQSTAATMAQIDEVIRSPGIAEVQSAANQPLPPPPKVPITRNLPDYSQTLPPGTLLSPGIAQTPSGAPKLPDTPTAIPQRPVPQPVPVPATPAELAAKVMIGNLLAVQKQFGIAGGKGKEDRNLVKKFQQLAGTTADGMAGPATLVLAAGKGAVDLPLVFYWPKTATASTVQQYKDSLERIAQKLVEVQRTSDAALLRASAAREKGQSGITGPAIVAPVAKTVAAPKSATPAPAPTAPPPAIVTAAVTDPHPEWPLLKQGDKGSMVKLWQGALVKGGFLPNKPASTDGAFGPGTFAATKLLQTKGRISADGIVGPNARKSARAQGLW